MAKKFISTDRLDFYDKKIKAWAKGLFATADTKNTAGSGNDTTKLYLIGAKTQSSAGARTFSNSNCYMSGGMLYVGDLPAAVSQYSVISKENAATTATAGKWIRVGVGKYGGAQGFQGTVSLTRTYYQNASENYSFYISVVFKASNSNNVIVRLLSKNYTSTVLIDKVRLTSAAYNGTFYIDFHIKTNSGNDVWVLCGGEIERSTEYNAAALALVYEYEISGMPVALDAAADMETVKTDIEELKKKSNMRGRVTVSDCTGGSCSAAAFLSSGNAMYETYMPNGMTTKYLHIAIYGTGTLKSGSGITTGSYSLANSKLLIGGGEISMSGTMTVSGTSTTKTFSYNFTRTINANVYSAIQNLDVNELHLQIL